MTKEEFDLLLQQDVRCSIEENLGRDPLDVALDRTIRHASLVATQVKYLTRAARKLPSYFAARCILPPLSFEQSSGEACASRKIIGGGSLLDLTCGLGADAFFLSRRFDRVVAVERDPVLAAVAEENFRRLGAANIEVVCSSAEEYVASCDCRFDWIYADPDRRSDKGRKLVCIGDCSPDIMSLRPALGRLSSRLCLKLSPMFDVAEAFRLFGRCRTEAISEGGECKEVVVYADGSDPVIAAVAIGSGEAAYPYPCEVPSCPVEFNPEAYHWLVVPDAAVQKARLAVRHLAGHADIWSDNGYGFAAERPDGIIGRTFEIDNVVPYDPRRLKRELRGMSADIMKRDFPLSTPLIASQLGVKEGGRLRLAFTRVGGELWLIKLK